MWVRTRVYDFRLGLGWGALESVWITRNQAITRSANTEASQLGAETMKKLFDGFGSDKSLAHDYHIPYGQLFGLVPLGAILEIGIGSVNPEYPGNMGSRGHPGASQAALRDSGFFTHVFGADIDRSILTNSPGITNFFVDQTDAGSLTNLRNEPFGTEISLIY